MVSAVFLCSIWLAVSPAEGPADPPDLAAYETARAGAGHDSGANVRLALWCEARGLRAERLKHLALAVLTDPSNATARGLMGLVAYRGQWKRPEAVAQKVKADEALTARLAEYNARRVKAPDTADGQWALAVWCEQNGLDAEALAHFTAVTRLDPAREAAWKRLGCKKVGNRWADEAELAAEKAEAEVQKKADRHWKPLLTKWRGWLDSNARRGAAEEALAGVNDPRAVPSVWSVFVAGKPANHELAVQLLGQIDAAGSSRGLAYLAVFDPSAEVRRAATETLRRRDPREFAGLLVALLRDPVKYEVRPVGGPGSPGTLVITTKQGTLKRVYAPPAMPNIPVMPGDFIATDANGLPVLERPVHKYRTGPIPAAALLSGDPSDPFNNAVQNSILSNPLRPTTRFDFTVAVGGEIPIGRVRLETLKTAAAAEQQLENDAAQIDRYNEGVNGPNDRIRAVLSEVAGRDVGPDAMAWGAWWVDQVGFRILPQKSSQETPTVVENVPLNYQPPPIPLGTTVGVAGFRRMSCFGGGTMVRTLDGSRPIESLRVGDRVLTQDVKTGALGYNAVTVVHHNPPSPTFLVKVGGDTIVSSPFHRFWVAGKGWVMARDLKGDEVLRLLDGPARIESVEDGPVQPVYNLDVAGDHDFFAGSAAALVHDNTVPDTRLAPFDAAPALASAGASR